MSEPRVDAQTIIAMSEEAGLAFKALELWREWFASDGDPQETGYCFFCGQLDNHRDGCIYVRAKGLIEAAEVIE